MIDNDGVTTPEIVEATGLTRRGAQKLLSRLMERRIIERAGSARNTRYRLVTHEEDA